MHKTEKTTNGFFTYYKDGEPEVNHTIEEKNYPEFFKYYESLIKEMDDEFGAWMNTRSFEFFDKNWEEIQNRMVTTMGLSIEELGKDFYRIPRVEFDLLLHELGDRVLGHELTLDELKKVFKETDYLPNQLSDLELNPILYRINNCW